MKQDPHQPAQEPADATPMVSESQAMRMLGIGEEVFGTGRDTLAASWMPPTLEELQEALPQYEVTELLGRGGMGAVYAGTQRALARPVAIKVLPPALDDAEGRFARRFQQEAQAMARLNHPNIVSVYEAGETAEGLLYFVMERVEGTDVARLITSEGPLSREQAVRIIVAVCEALAFAHEEGIIHRDIKPSNVMIDLRGRVKVADFGLAKQVSLPSEGAAVAAGTPGYMPPEAEQGSAVADARTDIYAVGVMLYQMLTGKLPRSPFPSPSYLNPNAGPAFDAVVERAMQTQPTQRYSTARELLLAVEKAAGGEKGKVLALSQGLVSTPRRRWIMAGGAAALAAGGWWSWSRPSPRRLRPEDYPAGKWVRVPFQDSTEVITTTGKFMRLPRLKVFYPPSAKGINWGIRVEFEGSAEKGQVPELLLRDGPFSNYNAYMPHEGSRLYIMRYDQLATSKETGRYHTLGTLELNPERPRGEPFLMEFVVINQHLLLRAMGQVLHLEAPDAPSPGRVGLYRPDQEGFRNLEVIRLDGLTEPEALRTAGFGDYVNAKPTPARPFTPPAPIPITPGTTPAEVK